MLYMYVEFIRQTLGLETGSRLVSVIAVALPIVVVVGLVLIASNTRLMRRPINRS